MSDEEGAVLDASIVAAWCFDDEASPDSKAMLDRFERGFAVVPTLWHFEVANLLAQGERRGRIVPERSAELLVLLGNLDVRTDDHELAELRGPILALTRTHGLTAYDAAYLELARRLALPLATLDSALRRAAAKLGVAVLPA